jgi:hypothetical protein
VFLIGLQGVPALLYQWGLASYSTQDATVVGSIVSHGRSTTHSVTVDLAGSQRMYDVRPRPLFSRLHPGQRVAVRLVRSEVVEIDLDGDSLPVDDELRWLVGAPGGLLLGGLVALGGYRRGRAEHSWWWPSASGLTWEDIGGRLGIIVLATAMALVFSGIVLGVSAWITDATPPWPAAVVVLAGWAGLWAKVFSRAWASTRRTATAGAMPMSNRP